MARQSTADRLAKIHQDALREFDDIQTALRDERLQCLKDRRFYSIAGAQWEGPLGEAFENKPRFEFNKIHLAVIRIFNEYRNNRITVDFTPKDGSADDGLADTCDGLYRADEKACSADEAYDNAFEEGVGGGYGAWRLRAYYEDDEDDEDERQRVCMEPLFDADSTVFYDLDAKRQDKADGKRCYVLTPYSHRAYLEEFGDDPASWPKLVHQHEFDWCTPDIVWVCEQYAVEEESETVRYFRGLDDEAEDMKVMQAQIDADPELLDQLAATGFRLVREKRITRRKIMKYTMSGGKLFDSGKHKPTRIAGRCIPIVPFFAKRWVVDGVERCMGHVRLATDAQRLINSLLSWLAEMAARFDIEKPIVTPEQIAGHATMWARDNIDRFPYLLLNALKDANGDPVPGSGVPAAYTRAPNIPPVMAALVQFAGQALEDMLGNQKEGEKLQPNLSGKALELIQTRLDMQVFIYMSNLAKAMKRCGEVWLSMMKDIVTERGRRMKTVDGKGQASSVVMNQPMLNAETGEEYLDNDISAATFEVDVDVGPSSSSKRAATVRALTALKQNTTDPQTLAILDALILMNIEGEGLSEANQFFRAKLVRMGVVKPTEEEAKQLAAEAEGAKPDPQAVYLAKAAEKEEALAAKARADTVETIASAELKQAQTRKTIAETEGETTQQALNVAEAFQRAAAPPAGMGAL